MEKKDYLKSFYLKDYSMIFAGLILYALGLTGFLLPNKIVTGGLAGITVLIKSTTDIPLWVSYLSINAVLLIVAWKIVGKSFVIKTVISVGVLTFLLRYGEIYITRPIIHADPLLSSMIGAMFCGAGLGLVYSVNGSTGGTDIIGAVVTKYRHVSMGRVLLLVDVLIIASSFFYFRSVEKIAIGLIVMAVMYY
ncbi:MAG: YitT family protein, partial [Paludibacteraceae bacterium]|nr:YitT family protein [Paludibacteraceae bacterium]